MKKNLIFFFILIFNISRAKNLGINTTGASPAATNIFEVLQTSSTAGSVGIYSAHSGAITGTGYGIWVEKTGASTTNIAGYYTASGATDNYAIIVPSTGGIVGIGTITPSSETKFNVVNTSTTDNTSAAIFSHTGNIGVGTAYGIKVIRNGGASNTSYGGDFYATGATTYNIGIHSNAIGATARNYGGVLWGSGPADPVGVWAYASGNGSATATGAIFSAASATNNYAIITTAGNVGIGNPAPTSLLHVGGSATKTLGVLSLGGNTSGNVTIQPAAAAGTYTMVLPNAQGAANSVLQNDGSGNLSWSTSTGGYTLQASAGTTTVNPTDATTYYTGIESITTTAAGNRIYVPRAGTIKSCVIHFVSGVVGTAETGTVYLRINNTTDVTVSAAVVNNSSPTVYTNTALSQAVSAGDYIELKWLTPTWVTNPTSVKWRGVIYIE